MKAFRIRAVVAILVLAVILAWLVLDQTSGPNPVRDAFSRIASPVQYALKRLVSPLQELFAGGTHWFGLAAENEALRQENAELRNQIILLHEAQIENENYRRQLDFKSAVPNYRLLSAEVIGRDPSNLLEYLLIDRGREDGIAIGMPVLTASGLVGRISEVSASSSKVQLITDSASSISVLVQRTRTTGMVQGVPGHSLVMRYIPQDADIAVGDIVLTSGLGGDLPKRLVVGQISSIRREDVDVFQEAQVVPAVDLSSLESVMVLLNFSDVSAEPEPTATPQS